MAELLGQALLELSVDDGGFTAGVAKAEGEARALDGTLKRTTATTRALTVAEERAAIATQAETAAIRVQHAAAGLNTAQMMALSHSVRSMAEQMALGVSPGQALTAQMSHISFLISGPGGLRGAVIGIGRLIGRLVARFWPLIAVIIAASAALVGMQHEINRTSKTHVSLGNTALAVWQVIRDGIYRFIKPAVDAVAPWFAAAWDKVIAITKFNGNGIINIFAAAFAAIKVLWNDLPGVIAHYAAAAANEVMAAAGPIVDTFRAAIAAIGVLWNDLPGIVGQGVTAAANAVIAATESMINRAVGLMNGLVGKVNAILPKSLQLGGIGEVSIGRLSGPANVASLGADLRKAIADSFSSPTAFGRLSVPALPSIGSDLSKAVSQSFSADPLGSFFSAVKQRAIENALKAIKDKSKKTARDVADGFAKAANEVIKAWENVKEFWAGTTKGFLSDLRQGLENGKGWWKSFADAALNAINRITDKVTGDLVDALFGVKNNTSAAGGIFGFLGNLFGSGSKGFAGLFATGGFIPPGQWGIVGERGPEPAFGGKSGMTVMPSGMRPIAVTMNITTPDVAGFRRARGQVAAELARAVDRGRRNL